MAEILLGVLANAAMALRRRQKRDRAAELVASGSQLRHQCRTEKPVPAVYVVLGRSRVSLFLFRVAILVIAAVAWERSRDPIPDHGQYVRADDGVLRRAGA
jgi:hypothetical protein